MKRILAVLTIGLVISSSAAMASSQQTVTHVMLRSVGTSHVTGAASVVYDNKTRHTTVTLTARGLAPGLHFAHIHVGHCGHNGDVKYALAPIQASRAGTGKSITIFPYKLAGAALYINIHGVPGKALLIVACGNL